MRAKNAFFYMIIAILITNNLAYENNEFYCKENEQKGYRICRRCPKLGENCEEPKPEEGCHCDNIAIYDKTSKNYTGGSDCLTSSEGSPFCFVSEASNCKDKEYSERANNPRLERWHSSDVYYSEEACRPENKIKNKEISKSGNEKILIGVKITSDHLYDGAKILQFSDLPFTKSQKVLSDPDYVPGYIECQEQCTLRKGVCGAWSFDSVNEICYLHNIDACCGQRGKQEEELAFISGYNCPCCWSTHNECPCDLKERVECSSDATVHTTGAAKVTSQSSVGIILVGSEVVQNRDSCACVHILGPRKKWKCFRPKCSKIGCQNPNRCRG